ncbi:dockerin type I domain-containing protein [Ideonella sp.]|uniref:dockerin type I domain-containing protein n=1 Tax=Ideonella sp. TaxID=1929293 RepID=UPI0035B29081
MALQAASLRPLAPGATWTYAGEYFGSPDFSVPYTDVVTHTGAPRGVTEAASNQFATGPASVVIALEGGHVIRPGGVDLDEDGTTDIVDPVLLRSPVREGDQIVYLDERTLTTADVDADGRMDSLDAAIFSRVIGRESVSLGADLGTVQAVRVDQTTLARMVLTTGSVWPTSTTVVSTWYAEGVGVVRRTWHNSSDGQSVPFADERLSAVTGL